MTRTRLLFTACCVAGILYSAHTRDVLSAIAYAFAALIFKTTASADHPQRPEV